MRNEPGLDLLVGEGVRLEELKTTCLSTGKKIDDYSGRIFLFFMDRLLSFIKVNGKINNRCEESG
jgi:hypothetical protein